MLLFIGHVITSWLMIWYDEHIQALGLLISTFYGDCQTAVKYISMATGEGNSSKGLSTNFIV